MGLLERINAADHIQEGVLQVKKICEKKLDYNSFQREVFSQVRQTNCYDLVSSWEHNILNSKFRRLSNTAFESRIIIAQQTVDGSDSYIINVHELLYMNGILFEGVTKFKKNEVDIFKKFAECYEKSNTVRSSLNDYHGYDHLVHDNIIEFKRL